ncbi:MAG: pentapeptide repeat-containing protein [Anaerolineae bacterium]|nr:pentapeptide repeat-containing protein [Anaerolineae bacterium]
MRKQISGAAKTRLIVIPILLIGGLVASLIGLARSGDWDSFALNLGTELLGAVLTFVLLELILGRQEKQETQTRVEFEQKAHLIRQMRSKDNGTALQSVEELRAQGWLAGETLRGADLYRANLEGANLISVDLGGATLREAILQGAYMRGVNLENADLSGANCLAAVMRDARMRGANLKEANLERADLRDAEIECATMANANLLGADLRGANLQQADLRGANLARAGFSRTILQGANLSGANLQGARSLTHERIQDATALRGATMPDGSRYNGHLRLQGDLVAAKESMINLTNSHNMAEFYGVSVDEYMQAQQD